MRNDKCRARMASSKPLASARAFSGTSRRVGKTPRKDRNHQKWLHGWRLPVCTPLRKSKSMSATL